MYKKFFGLADNPFNIVPDPRYLFHTPETDEAFANLIFGVRAHRGIILLTGEVGTGKTILLKKLMNGLRDESAATAFVFNPQLNPTEFLDFVLSDFGIPHDNREKLRMVNAFYQWLLGRQRTRQTSVLIVDEAHDLTPEVLEEIRLFSNLETPSDKLLQIVLSGQPEIEKKLALPEMRLFRQRIALRNHTCPLSAADTSRYIAHRLRVAGGDAARIFSPEAMSSVFHFSQGIPRVINLLCEQALISAYADEEKPVGAAKVREAAEQYQLLNSAPPASLLSEGLIADPKPTSLAQTLVEVAKLAELPTQKALPSVSPQAAEMEKPEEASVPVESLAQAPAARKPLEVASRVPLVAPPGAQAQASPIAMHQPAKPIGRLAIENDSPPPHAPPEPTEISRQHSSQTPSASEFAAPPAAEISTDAQKSALLAAPAGPGVADQPEVPSRETRSPISAGGERNPPRMTPAPANAGKEGRDSRRASKPALRTGGTLRAAKQAPAVAVSLRLGQPPRGEEHSRGFLWTVAVVIAVAMGLSGYYVGRDRSVLAELEKAFSSQTKPVRADRRTATIYPSHKPSQAPSRNAIHVPAMIPAPSAVPNPAAGKETRIAAVQTPNTGPQLRTPGLPLEAARREPEKKVAREAAATIAKAEPPTVAEPAAGQLLVTSNLPGATVTIDGRSDPDWITPHTFTDLRPGSYEVGIFRKGSLEAQKNVDIEAGKLMIMSATLVAASGQLVLTTNPPGAEVFIDGKSYGASPVRATVAAGLHTFSARLAGREAAEGNATVEDQAVVTRNLDLPPALSPPKMNVQVTTNPPQATVYADGTPVGATPISFHMSPGVHTLIISASGFRPVRREIEVPEDGTASVTETLTAE